MRLTILVIAALLFSLVSLRFFFAPYAWIFLSWLLVCIYVVKHGNSALIRATAVNVGAVLLVLGGVEGFFYYALSGEPQRDEARNQDDKIIKRTIEHDVLGWAPRKSEVVSLKRYFGDTLLFDVVYTFDRNGLRTSS